MLSSGTVGAALEGSIGGRKAVAVSFPFFQGFDNWSTADIDSAVQVAPPPIPEFLLAIHLQAVVFLAEYMDLSTSSR